MIFYARTTAIVTSCLGTMRCDQATGVVNSAMRRLHPFKKLVVVMKLTAILLLIGCLQVSANGFAQGKITMRKAKATLEEVLVEINKQTGVLYSANNETLKKAVLIDINVKNEELGKVLGICFAGQPLTYSLKENIIIVKEKVGSVKMRIVEERNPIDVRGKVTDERGNPVQGVTVTIKGTDKHTLTDDNGEFSLASIDREAVLVFTSVNMEMFEVKVNGQAELTVKLRTKVSALENVTVTVNTGYEKIPKERATGSFAFVSKEQLDQRVATTIIDKLEGITNGLVFNKDPEDGSNKLRVRGESTIFGYDKPLVVVDNFPYSFDRINEINPNDVENITILKDAAAASIWGVQAGNGVIVITTKRGKLNQPLRVGLNANMTITGKPDLFYSPLIAPSDYIDIETLLFNNGRFDFDLMDPGYQVVSPVVEILNRRKSGIISAADSAEQIDALRKNDWRNDYLKNIYRKALSQQYQINLSGGSNKTSYYFSAGFDKSFLSLIGDESQRITLNNTVNFRPVNNLDLQMGLSYSEGKSINNSLSGNIPNLYPYMNLINEDGSQIPIPQRRAIFEDTIVNRGFLNWKYYPLQERNNRDNNSKLYSIRAVASVRYTIIKGLNIEGSYQYYRSIGKVRNLTQKNAYSIRNSINRFAIVVDDRFTGSNYPAGGTLGLTNSDLLGHNGRLKIEFNKQWQKHAIATTAGVDVREERSETNSSLFLGYDDATGSFATPNTFIEYPVYYPSGSSTIGGSNPYGLTYTGTISRFKSYYGITNYTFNGRYSLQGSIRFDGSNYFGVKTNNKTVPLWSTGVKWDISKENFYNLEQIPQLSLRVTYGYNGNLSPSTVAITTFSYYGNANYTGLPFAIIANTPNPELRWEKSGQLNLGLDFSSKDNKISGSIEYFKKNGKDLIGDVPLDPTTGVNQLRGNFSDMRTTGVDVQVITKNINRAFKWNTTFIFNYAKDIITRYDIPSDARSYLVAYKGNLIPLVGHSLRSLFSYRWGGLDPATGDPRIILGDTLNKTYSPTTLADIKVSDLIYSGKYDPPYAGAILNTFSYKGISLTINMTYKAGHYFRRNSINYSNLSNSINGWLSPNKDYSNRWQKPGDEQVTSVPSFIYPDDSFGQRDEFYNASNILVEKADHLRLQFINVDYSIDPRILRNIRFQSLNIYVYANNLGIIWRANKNNVDPDYPYLNSAPAKSFSVGIRAGF